MGDQARILIVCTGNICRSPFIERLLQLELDGCLSASEAGFSAARRPLIVRSAGTGALVGSAIDAQAAAQLVARGGDASAFAAREVTPDLIAEADLVLTATRGHRGKVALMSPKVLRRVFTFCDFADLVKGIDSLQDSAANLGPRERVRQVTERAAARRGLNPPLAPQLSDIVDPYRRGDDVFAAMASQIADSMPAVVRALVG